MSLPALAAAGPLGRQPIVLLGSCGMLGWAFQGLLEVSTYRWRACTRDDADLRDRAGLRRLFDEPVRTVINCAAWTDVDGAEAHEAEAMAVNGTAVAWLAEQCREHGALLVNFGTDYVFDGRAREPYAVGAPRAPVGAYGRSKLAGELALEGSGCRFLNIRTSWLYAPWGKNFVRTIHALAQQRPVLKVVNDQRGRPTSAEHLAISTLRLIGAGASGHWHVTDGGECTWYELAREIKRLGGGAAEIVPCSSEEFPRPARRPAYSVLDLSATEALLGPMPGWRENLADVMRRLEP